MKKFYLFLLTVLVSTVSAFAQDLEQGDYLIKHQETGKYLNGSNSWGTKASVTEHGQFMTLELSDGKYAIDSHYSNGGDKHYVAAGEDTYIDGAKTFHSIVAVEGGYTIQDPNGKYLVSDGNLANFNGDEPQVWQFITREEFIASLSEATAESPIDATALVPDAGFSRNNSDFNLWIGESKMGKGGPNNALDATANGMNAERWGGNSTSIDFYTTVSNLPNGKYTVNFQGLYRYNTETNNSNDVAASSHADGTEVINAFFYANEDAVPFVSIADEDAVALYGKMPFSQAEASEAFTKGCYKSSFETVVTDGTLTLRIEKLAENHPGCDWTVLDNIELYYQGADAEPSINLGLNVPGEENVVNISNGNTSVEAATGIEVSFDGIIPQTATYTIQDMIMVVGEESSQWVANQVIAEGEISLHGAAGVAEFEEPMTFYQGERYVLSIEAKANGEVIASQSAEFNGATVLPAIAEVAIVNGEEQIALNSHASISVETAEAIKATFGNPVDVKEASYTISSMIEVAGEESSSWELNETIAEGTLSINTYGYATFEEPIVFEQGTKYQIAIKVVNLDETEETATYTIDGATAAPAIASATILAGEEQITLNTKTAVSVEKMDAIKVTFGNSVDVESATVAISAMVAQEGEEGTSYVPGVPEVFSLSINTIGYAEKAYTFEQGTLYQIEVKVTYKDQSEDTAEYLVNGATVSEDDDEAITVSGNKDGVKLTFTAADVAPSYNVDITLNGEKVELDFDEDWNITNILYVNNKNLADGDYTLVFPAGSLVINTVDNEEEYTVQFTIADGVVVEAEPEPSITTFLAVAGEENAVNISNGNTSVEAATGIEVAFDGIIPQTATYTIQDMIMVVGEESSEWVANQVIAEGEISLHGAAGVAEFEEPMTFYQGERYVITIEAKAMDVVIATQTAEFNGATVVPAIAELAIIAGEEQIALNSHASVSVEAAEAIKATFGNPVDVKEASYTISSMIEVAGEESSSWELNETIAEGALSINTYGYAEFEEPIVFEQGTKYQVAIKVVNLDETEETAVYTIDGATAAPVIAEAVIIAGEEMIALNSKTSVSVEKMDAIKVTFGNSVDVESATVAISPLVAIDGEEGVSYVPGVPEVITLSINTIGYAEKAYTFEQGTKYQIDINVNYKDGSEETVSYSVDGATVSEEEDKDITVSGDKNDVKLTFAAADVAPSWNEPITLNGNKVDLEFDEDFFVTNVLHLNNQNLADGDYKLVFTVGSLVINGVNSEEEYVVAFSIVNGVVVEATTGIKGINTTALKNGKFIKNNKIVIIKNGVMYNVNGTRF